MEEEEEEEVIEKEEEEEEDLELLQSTSCFLPVLEDDTAALASTLSSFASSLSHAYGLPDSSEAGQGRASLLSDLLLRVPEGDAESVSLTLTDGELILVHVPL